MTKSGALASLFFSIAIVVSVAKITNNWSDVEIAKAAMSNGYQQDSRGNWIIVNKSTNVVDGVK